MMIFLLQHALWSVLKQFDQQFADYVFYFICIIFLSIYSYT